MIISSIPLQGLILEACETLVVDLHIHLLFINNAVHRKETKNKIAKLDALIPILAEILKNNESDS